MNEVSDYFLNVRKERREKDMLETPSESELITEKTNRTSEANNNPLYLNNLSSSVFENIVKKQLMYELDDYKTNYVYSVPNQVDQDFKFNLKIQDNILEFINENMYGKNNVYKLMRVVNETMNLALEIFSKEFKLDKDDIKFIFYNDVVLRKMVEKFIYTLPNKNSINLSKYFDKYFNSDSLEWYVILHPELENYEDIHKKLSFYIALVMKQINLYITVHKRELFEYFKYNNKYKQYVILKLNSLIENSLNNMKEYNIEKSLYEAEMTYIKPSVHSYKYDDNVVLLNNNSEEHLFQLNIVENEENIVFHQCLSMNVIIKNEHFNKNNEYMSHQSSMLIPINLVTVTLGSKTDTFVSKLIRSKNNMRNYSYVFSLDNVFSFNGLSFKFICDILEEKAYDEEPWIELEWKFTYGRLMFFYIIDLFVNIKSNRIRNSVVTLSKKYINLLLDINKEFSKGDEKEMERIYKMIMRKYDNTKNIKLNIKLLTLMKNIHRYNLTYRYNVKFKDFIEFIYEILSVNEQIFEGVHTYCTKSNELFENTLYKGDIKYVI